MHTQSDTGCWGGGGAVNLNMPLLVIPSWTVMNARTFSHMVQIHASPLFALKVQKRQEHVSFSLNVFHKATRTHVIISQCSLQTHRNLCHSVSMFVFFHKATRTRVIISQSFPQKDWNTCYSVSMFFTQKKTRTHVIISQCSPQRDWNTCVF